MVGHGAHGIPLEVVGTMIEMADVAWYALEHRPGRKGAAEGDNVSPPPAQLPLSGEEVDEIAQLRLENVRLRNQLSENLALLQGLYKEPISKDCPPDLYTRLVAAVDSSNFLNKLESLNQVSKAVPSGRLLSDDITGLGLEAVDIPIIVDEGEPSWWVWVSHDISTNSLEEVSGIDNENYVIISEENVIDGIANFIARCILENSNSKILSAKDLQNAVMRALGGMKEKKKWRSVWEAGKIIYTMSTWGIAFAGLYGNRTILKAAAKGVSASSKLVMKVL
ncbi:uncharacterized protein [Typha latifolia]|uniref:uncharacterized protein n=1 Tax=Typha latifolia TaxID=4733 RepID=UPI003C2D236F